MFKTALPSQSGRLRRVLSVVVGVTVTAVAIALFLSRGTGESDQPLLGVVRSGHADFERYLKSVQLENRGIKMLKNLTGKRTVGFAGAITNHNDRQLDVVEIRLTLFNAHEAVFETIRTPIKPGPYTPPILSGKTRGFAVYLEDFPKSWWASRAEMEISGMRWAGSESEREY